MRTGRQCGAGVPPAWSPRKPAFSQHRWRARPRAGTSGRILCLQSRLRDRLRFRGDLASNGACTHDIAPATTHRPRVAWIARGLGAWLSFRREKVPGTAPIAFLETRTRPSPPRGRPPARHRCGRSPLNRPSRDRAVGATLGRPRHEPRRTRRPETPGPHPTRTKAHFPERSAVSRTRDASRNETDGQAGRPPPHCGPNGGGSGSNISTRNGNLSTTYSGFICYLGRDP